MERNSRKIQIMKGFLPYFRILKAYNLDTFGGEWAQISSKIGQLLFVFIFFGSDIIFNILSHWHYVEKRIIVDPKALPILFIGHQILLTHISGVKNNRLMSETLYRLQIAIEQRRFIAFYWIKPFFVRVSLIDYLIFFSPRYGKCWDFQEIRRNTRFYHA